MQKDKGFMPAVILTVICLVTATLLALTNQLTFSERLKLEAKAADENQHAMFATAAVFDPFDISSRHAEFIGIESVAIARDDAGAVMGYVIQSSARGYGGDVPILVAIEPAGKLANLKILGNEETPGLGKKVEEKSFFSQFIGKATNLPFSVNPAETGKTRIDAIAGATISSRAVTDAVNQAAAAATKIAAEVK